MIELVDVLALGGSAEVLLRVLTSVLTLELARLSVELESGRWRENCFFMVAPALFNRRSTSTPMSLIELRRLRCAWRMSWCANVGSKNSHR
jgi:hypothetical protein